MNRRDLFKSSAVLAAAVVGFSNKSEPEEDCECGPLIRLADDCQVICECRDYPCSGWFFIDEQDRFRNYGVPGVVFSTQKRLDDEELREKVEEIWKQHCEFDQPNGFPKVIPGWSYMAIR